MFCVSNLCQAKVCKESGKKENARLRAQSRSGSAERDADARKCHSCGRALAQAVAHRASNCELHDWTKKLHELYMYTKLVMRKLQLAAVFWQEFLD